MKLLYFVAIGKQVLRVHCTGQVGALSEGLAMAAGQPPATNSKMKHQVDGRCFVEIKKI